jgi:hypothetical protein
MITLNIFILAIVFIFLTFLWLTVFALNKPTYNYKNNIWEEDKSARNLSKVALVFMLIIVFYLGYLFN